MNDPFPLEAQPSPPEKYWSETDSDRHPGPVIWPGAKGFPVLGDTSPMLYPHEVAKLPVVAYGYVRMFDLSDPAQAEYYAWILDRAGNQLFSIDHRSWHPVEYTDANGNKAVKMFVHAEWRQFYTVPGRAAARGPTHDPRNYTLG